MGCYCLVLSGTEHLFSSLSSLLLPLSSLFFDGRKTSLVAVYQCGIGHCGNAPLWQCAIVACANVTMRHCGTTPKTPKMSKSRKDISMIPKPQKKQKKTK